MGQENTSPSVAVPSPSPPQAGANARPQPRAKPRGYYELAERMVFAENELAIFRNFKELNILSLLQLQAEIILLQSDLEWIRNNDDLSDETIAVPFSIEERGFPEGVDAVPYQRKLFSSYGLLLQFDQICKLKQPEEIELLSIKKWTLERMKNREVPFMKPPEGLAYRPFDLDRYVLVQKPDREKDIVPPLFLHWYSRLYSWLSGKGKVDIADTRRLFLRPVEDRDGQLHFTKSYLVTAGNWLAPVLSSVLLVSASLILYSIRDTRNKLFAMIPLTVTFSLIVKGFTSASRAEIFVAVAGFVAVEVVFVGNVS
ncbi:hypothetical protein C8A03DRAFT_36946 [Achaetomium macrosporum]|uniref:DUF6594 domain-containing protein n=1 Tax=Achaetomium macrosporum TaxID=79813 RepID=A0AAN7H4Y9_9PEZI|nr:hypothetical protein C8A03DRAFT_36946 [Achaetomium macrosporum]